MLLSEAETVTEKKKIPVFLWSLVFLAAFCFVKPLDTFTLAYETMVC